MRKRQTFDIEAAIAKAWDLIWADNVKNRGQDYRASHGHYIVRSDLVNQVRQFAIEQSQGKSWGATGRCNGRPWGTSKVRITENVDSAVCAWLRKEQYAGHIQAHNFGRGHISGMRYRPAGESITETEKATMAAKERRANTPRPRHFAKNWEGTLLCMPPRSIYSSWRHRRGVYTTSKPEEVTCPRCLKKLAEEGQKLAETKRKHELGLLD